MMYEADFLEKMTYVAFKSVMDAGLHIFPNKEKMTKNLISDRQK